MKKPSCLKIAGRLSLVAALTVFAGLAHATGDGEKTDQTAAHEYDSLPGMEELKAAKCGKQLEKPERMDQNKPNPEMERLKEALGNELIGQEEAIKVLADAFEKMQGFMGDPDKPVGRFMFLGPTGVGKTELVRALVRYLGGNPDVHMIRFDGGEYQFDHEISGMKGTTAGYAGFDKKPGLHPDNIVAARLTFTLPNGTKIDLTILLFDEFEKMGNAAFQLMLGILDNGKITLGDQTPSFLRKTIVIATSNLGAREVNQLIDSHRLEIKARKERGEQVTEAEEDETGRLNLPLREKIDALWQGAVAKKYAPEFLPRWHAFIPFRHLRKQEYLKISNVMLAKVQKRVFTQAPTKFVFQLTPAAREWLISKGTDIKNGSRELLNTIELNVTHHLSRLMITQQIKAGDLVVVGVDPKTGLLTYDRHWEGLNEEQMKAHADKVYPGMKMKGVKFAVASDDSLEDKKAVVSALLNQIGGSPLAMSSLWQEAAKSKQKQAAKTGSGVNPETDSETYKYISIEGVIVRLYISSKEVEELRRKNPALETTVPVRYKVYDDGIPEAEKLEYVAPATLHETSIRYLEWMRNELNKQKPGPK